MKIFALLALQLVLAAVPAAPAVAQTQTRHVVLAGGCFWGMQMVFEKLKGVSKVVAGYSGGNAATAHYDIVSTGSTGHAESVDVTYDPSQISFDTLLKVYFFVAEDPTELNYQGPDHGTQYRSVIFYADASQKRAAEAMIRSLQTGHAFSRPIVTQVVPLKAFYRAEDYHQEFGVHNPDNPYIVANDLPKVATLRERFPNLVR
ncbi:MAG TPA: peptide-methionine (S)-S-oxide reductase MsrA [Candidatus Baltobacteraceae bacterium]